MNVALFLTGWLLAAIAVACVIAAFIEAGKRVDRGLAGQSVHNGEVY